MRELKVGEEVMDITGSGYSAIGDIGIVEVFDGQHWRVRKGGNVLCRYRKELLTIDDRVKLGPDGDGSGVGKVGTVTALQHQKVSVRWPEMFHNTLEMSPTCQKLAHADEEEGKAKDPLEGYEEFIIEVTAQMVDAGTCTVSLGTITEEDAMTREERAVECDNEVKKHENIIIGSTETIVVQKAKAKRFRDFKTDREDDIALVIEIRGCSKKKAEAILIGKERGIEV